MPKREKNEKGKRLRGEEKPTLFGQSLEKGNRSPRRDMSVKKKKKQKAPHAGGKGGSWTGFLETAGKGLTTSQGRKKKRADIGLRQGRGKKVSVRRVIQKSQGKKKGRRPSRREKAGGRYRRPFKKKASIRAGRWERFNKLKGEGTSCEGGNVN